MTKDLQKYLKENADIQSVFFNDNGEWMFHEREGFDQEYSREDILDMHISESAADKSNVDTQIDTSELEATVEKLISVEGERDELLAENEALKADKADFEKSIESLQSEKTELEATVEKLEASIKKLKEKSKTE